MNKVLSCLSLCLLSYAIAGMGNSAFANSPIQACVLLEPTNSKMMTAALDALGGETGRFDEFIDVMEDGDVKNASIQVKRDSQFMKEGMVKVQTSKGVVFLIKVKRDCDTANAVVVSIQRVGKA